jgi:hypothetical protein
MVLIRVIIDLNKKESTFHGGYFKGLLKDRSNIVEKTHVKLYFQPGIHAFLPRSDMFELIPNLHTGPFEGAGNMGFNRYFRFRWGLFNR